MVHRKDITLDEKLDTFSDTVRPVILHAHVYLPDASFLIDGHFEKVGFDLVITNPHGETFIVQDYFAFQPPPLLAIASGASLNPDMVLAKLHLPFGEELMFAGPAGSAALQEEIGEVTLVLGDVTVKRTLPSGQTEEVDLKRGDILYKGDEITTGDQSFLKARMLDGTRFHLGKNANAALTEFAYDESQNIGTFAATVYKGGFHYRSGKIGEMFPGGSQSHSTISTPSAIIGIRGSELDGYVDAQGNTTIVHRSGVLEVTDVTGQNQVILDIPGNTSFVTFSGFVSKTEVPSQDQIEALNQNLPPADTPEELTEQETEEADAAEEEEVTGEAAQEEAQDEATEEEAGQEEEPREEESEEEETADEADDDPASGEAGEGEAAEAETGQRAETSGGNEPAGQQAGSGEAGATDGVTVRQQQFDQDSSVDVTDTSSDPSGNTGSAADREGSSDSDSGSGDSRVEILDVPETDTDSGETDTREGEGETPPAEIPPDNPPTAVDDTLLVSEPGTIDLTGAVLANDFDGDEGQEPSLVAVTGGSQGGVTSFDGRSLTYTPDETLLDSLRDGETTTETFSYRIQSGDLTDTGQVVITLVGTNAAPVAEDDTGRATEDTAITLDVLANDSDPDGDSLTIVSVDQAAARGTVTIETGGLSYLPPDDLTAGEVALDEFTYRVSDGQDTSTGTISITLTGANDPPTIDPDAPPVQIDASAGSVVVLELSDIFTDADLGDELSIVELDTSGTKGTITIGSIIYEPGNAFDFLAQDERATDSFFIRVQDQFGGTGSGVFSFEIIGINDAPVAAGDIFTTESGAVLDSALAGQNLLDNDTDVDNNDVLTAELVTGPENGVLQLRPDGHFTYTPADGFTGTDRFIYRAVDKLGAFSEATVQIDVGVTNAPPTVVSESFSIAVDEPLSGNLLANDADPEGTVITAQLSLLPSSGAVDLQPDGTFIYTPAPGFSGTDSFTYLVSDSDGRAAEGTVSISVADNLPPEVVNPLPDGSVSANGFFTVNVASVFSDPDGDPLTISLSGAEPAFVTLAGSTLQAVPGGQDAGSYSITLVANDGSATTTSSFNLNVNAPPPNTPATVLEGDSLTVTNLSTITTVGSSLSVTDPEGLTATSFSIGTQGEGTANIDPQTGVWDYTPPSPTFLGYDVFTVTVTDAAGGVTSIPINILIRPPDTGEGSFVVSGSSASGLEDTSSITATFQYTDPDGLAAAPYTLLSQPASGASVTLDAVTGVYTYVPLADFNGTDSFTIKVTDAYNYTYTETVQVLISPVNDGPPVILSGGTGTGPENTTLSGTLVVSDPDGLDPTPYLIHANGPDGTATIDATTGAWTFTPNSGFTGNTAFFVEVFDQDGFSDTVTVTLTISINQEPVVSNPGPGSLALPLNVSGGFSIDFTDNDGDLLSIGPAEISPGSGFGLVLSSTQSGNVTTVNVSISPTATGVFTLDITASDGFGGTATETVTITVGQPVGTVAGTQSYTLTPSFNDYIESSSGADNLTLIGAAESGDEVRLGQGLDTLTLDNSGNVLTIEGVEVLNAGAGADVITFVGSFDYLTASVSGLFTGGLNSADTFINNGYLWVLNDTFATAASFTIASNGTLDIWGRASPASVTLQSAVVNSGTIILDGDAGATLTISSATLTNNGNLYSWDTDLSATTPHALNANFINGSAGSIVLQHSLAFAAGANVDLSTGSLTIDPGQQLIINNGSLSIGQESALSGGGSILLLGATTLVVESFVLLPQMPTLDLAGAVLITGAGPQLFEIQGGAELTANGGEIFATNLLVTEGKLNLLEDNNALNGTLQIGTLGVVTIDGTAPVTLTMAGPSITNAGLLVIDNSSASPSATTLSMPGAILVNNGTLRIQDTDGGLGAADYHVINGMLDNSSSGVLELAGANLRLIGTASLTNLGTWRLKGHEFWIDGAPALTNAGSIFGTSLQLNPGATLTNSGLLAPDDGAAGADTLTIDGNLSNVSGGVLQLDVLSTSTNDKIVITGNNSAGGTIDLRFAAGHGFTGGERVQDVLSWTGSLTGTGTYTIVHNLGPGYTVTLASDDGGNPQVRDITVTASGFLDFDNGAGNALWFDALNWAADTLPGSSDNARIGSLSVTFDTASTTPNPVNSLTLDSGGSLALLDGTLELGAAGVLQGAAISRVASGSTLTLNSGAAGTAALVVNDQLIVDGNMAWNNGPVSGSTGDSLLVNGSLDLTIGNTATLNLDLSVAPGAALTIDTISSNTLGGSGQILNAGTNMSVKGIPTINVPVTNQLGGKLTLGDASSVSATFGATVTNHGLLELNATSAPVTMTLNAVSLLNTGEVRFTGANSPTLVAGTPIDNQGLLNVDSDTTINVDGSSLLTGSGTIDVKPGAILTLAGGASGSTLVIGSGTQFTSTDPGTGPALIAFTGNHTLNVAGNTFLDTTVTLDTGGATSFSITGTGTLTLGSSTTLELGSGDLATINSFKNQGTLKLSLSGSAITISSIDFDNKAGGIIDMTGGGVGFNTFETFDNYGSMNLTQESSLPNKLEIGAGTTVGTLINHGVFTSAQLGSDTQANLFKGTFINYGQLNINYSLDLDETSSAVTHENSGSISISAGQTLTLAAGDSLTNKKFASIGGAGTLDVRLAPAFLNQGDIVPGDYGSVGTLTIANGANMVLTRESVIRIEIDQNGASADQLVISDNAVELAGELRISKLNVDPTTALGTHSIVSATTGTITGSFSYIGGTDFQAGSNHVIRVIQNPGDVQISAVPVGAFGQSAGADALTGTVNADVIHGLAGDDTIDISNGSAGDIVFGGSGKDTIITDGNFSSDPGTRIVGGEGMDTLKLVGSAPIDFRTDVKGHQIEEIEVLDLRDSGTAVQTITLDALAIRSIVDGHDQSSVQDETLVVLGDSDDHLIVYGDFTEAATYVSDEFSPGNFKTYIELQLSEATTGSTTVTSLAFDEELLVEVFTTTSTLTPKLVYGSGGDDAISLPDSVFVKLDGRGGVDSLLGSGSIDLTGVTNIRNFEKFDMRDGGTGIDTLNIDLADIFDANPATPDILGDDALGLAKKSFIIDGDATDQVTLNGNTLWDLTTGVTGLTSDFNVVTDPFGTGDDYIVFSDANLDVYVHVDLVDPNPFG